MRVGAAHIRVDVESALVHHAAPRDGGASHPGSAAACRTHDVRDSNNVVILGPGVLDGQTLAGVACRRRQEKYESPQSTPAPAAQPHASGPSPTERCAVSAEARSMAKPA